MRIGYGLNCVWFGRKNTRCFRRRGCRTRGGDVLGAWWSKQRRIFLHHPRAIRGDEGGDGWIYIWRFKKMRGENLLSEADSTTDGCGNIAFAPLLPNPIQSRSQERN